MSTINRTGIERRMLIDNCLSCVIDVWVFALIIATDQNCTATSVTTSIDMSTNQLNGIAEQMNCTANLSRL